MNIYIPTCKRPDMAERLIKHLPDAVLVINNCDASEYNHIKCEKVVLDFTGNASLCSNLAFTWIIQNAPLSDDLLIIEDDTEPCNDLEREIDARANAIEEAGHKRYTINPLWTPARNTRYTAAKESRVAFTKYQFIQQCWVDTNLFIPQQLLLEFKTWYTDAPPIKQKSNGIGKHHSVNMFEAEYPMFTCIPSLLAHGDHESLIYPEGRKRVPLIAVL